MNKVLQTPVVLLENVPAMIIGLVSNVTNVKLDGLVKIVINVPQDMMDTHIAKVSKQNKLVPTNVICS